MAKASYKARLRGWSYVSDTWVYLALTEGQPLVLKREPANRNDPNAIVAADLCGADVAYIEREIAARVAPRIDAGEVWLARVLSPARRKAPKGRHFAIALLWTDGEHIEIIATVEKTKTKGKEKEHV